MRISDWSSDVCSSDLQWGGPGPGRERPDERPLRDHQPGRARRAPGVEQRDAGPRWGQDALHRGADRARRHGPRDRTSVVSGKSVSVSVEIGGHGINKKKKKKE